MLDGKRRSLTLGRTQDAEAKPHEERTNSSLPWARKWNLQAWSQPQRRYCNTYGVLVAAIKNVGGQESSTKSRRQIVCASRPTVVRCSPPIIVVMRDRLPIWMNRRRRTSTRVGFACHRRKRTRWRNSSDSTARSQLGNHTKRPDGCAKSRLLRKGQCTSMLFNQL